MKIPEHISERGNALAKAVADQKLAILECTFQATSEPAFVLCRVEETEKEFLVEPIFVIHEEDPSDIVTPPEGMNLSIDEKEIH